MQKKIRICDSKSVMDRVSTAKRMKYLAYFSGGRKENFHKAELHSGTEFGTENIFLL